MRNWGEVKGGDKYKAEEGGRGVFPDYGGEENVLNYIRVLGG